MHSTARVATRPHRKRPLVTDNVSVAAFSVNTFSTSRSRSAVCCAQCGDPIIMPEWSEWVDAGYARHLWHCDGCDYSFETRVVFAAA